MHKMDAFYFLPLKTFNKNIVAERIFIVSDSQLHPSIPQMPPQVNRQCPPGAPSPIGSVGVSAASAGPVMHHLPAPPLHHPFFPPFSSLIVGAGAQFGIPPGSAAASNILAAAQQQQQHQMAAFRRNNSASAGQSGAVTTNQQQQAVTAAQQPNASLLPPFVPQGVGFVCFSLDNCLCLSVAPGDVGGGGSVQF